MLIDREAGSYDSSDGDSVTGLMGGGVRVEVSGRTAVLASRMGAATQAGERQVGQITAPTKAHSRLSTLELLRYAPLISNSWASSMILLAGVFFRTCAPPPT